MSDLDQDEVFLPDPDEIKPHALAFARMMFAHTAFEREVRELQSDIAMEHGFGEREGNQWLTSERAKRMVALIRERFGKGLPETGPIEKLLTDAAGPCRQRNLLAHGAWWCFNRRTLTIQVRSGVRFKDDEPPGQREYRAADIEALSENFKDIEAELYKLRRSLCPPPTGPQHEDWNFANIEQCEPDRAARLTATGDPSELLAALECELRAAIAAGNVRFGVDCDSNNKGNRRAIIQFPVARTTYDWFFNARTGYRAQFWAGPIIGDRYNRRIVQKLRKLIETLPDEITARKIGVEMVGASREGIDKGPVQLRRDAILRSLDPQVAKIWICEWLIHTEEGKLRPTLAAQIAERHLPKLNIPRWATAQRDGQVGEGLRAPCPDEPSGWLDLKGGFVDSGKVYQLKPPTKRATDLCARGWT